MAFKPLTRNQTVKTDSLTTKTAEEEAMDKLINSTKLPDIVKTTEERIRIIFDNSGSMTHKVPNSAPAGVALTKSYYSDSYDQDLTRIELAQDATIDYMKNCKPRVTAVELAPLNGAGEELTKNLPKLATDIKALNANGETALYRAMGKLVDKHKEVKYTRALIFTDGQATDEDYTYPECRPTLFNEVKSMEIPIDLIIIGNVTEASLSQSEQELKTLIESTGGTFLICKDGNAFKEKMKYFAPLLRHMLPAIASKDERGN